MGRGIHAQLSLLDKEEILTGPAVHRVARGTCCSGLQEELGDEVCDNTLKYRIAGTRQLHNDIVYS